LIPVSRYYWWSPRLFINNDLVSDRITFFYWSFYNFQVLAFLWILKDLDLELTSQDDIQILFSRVDSSLYEDHNRTGMTIPGYLFSSIFKEWSFELKLFKLKILASYQLYYTSKINPNEFQFYPKPFCIWTIWSTMYPY